MFKKQKAWIIVGILLIIAILLLAYGVVFGGGRDETKSRQDLIQSSMTDECLVNQFAVNIKEGGRDQT